MKKNLIFDLDGTLIRSNNQIDRIIYDYISKEIWDEYIEHAIYLVKNNQWMSIYEWLEILLDWDEKAAKFHGNKIYDKINKISWEVDFFEWIPAKIKELSQKYRLFLSTGNSDEFAEKMLKKWWIYDCFEKVLWSTYYPKSPEHINQFIRYTQDQNFVDESVFIWDGQVDEAIAKFHGMDFIHISPFAQKQFQIRSVKDINTILDNCL